MKEAGVVGALCGWRGAAEQRTEGSGTERRRASGIPFPAL